MPVVVFLVFAALTGFGIWSLVQLFQWLAGLGAAV
jgi:hypothetical protein